MLGIMLVGLGIAEIGEHAVTHVLGHETTGLGDYLGAPSVISADDLPQLLGVEPGRQCGGADEVAEHDRNLAALGFGERAADAVGLVRGFSRIAGPILLPGG